MYFYNNFGWMNAILIPGLLSRDEMRLREHPFTLVNLIVPWDKRKYVKQEAERF